MIKRLVSLGSVIVDLVLEVPALPDRGGDVLASQRGMAAGGAFNVLSAAARLGLPGLYAGPHGMGPFGDLVRAALAREGVQLVMPPNPHLDTGWTLALVEPDGERTFVTVTGADAVVVPEALRAIEYRDGDAVYVSGYDLAYPDAGAAIAEHAAALAPNLVVLLDPSPLVVDIESSRLAAVLGRVDVLSRLRPRRGQLDPARGARRGDDPQGRVKSGAGPIGQGAGRRHKRRRRRACRSHAGRAGARNELAGRRVVRQPSGSLRGVSARPSRRPH